MSIAVGKKRTAIGSPCREFGIRCLIVKSGSELVVSRQDDVLKLRFGRGGTGICGTSSEPIFYRIPDKTGARELIRFLLFLRSIPDLH